MKSKRKILIIIISAIILGSFVIYGIYEIRFRPRYKGSISLSFQLRNKNDKDIVVESTNFTNLKVAYNQIEREKCNVHLEYIYSFPERWKNEEYIIVVVWENDTVKDHYWVEKVDNEILMTMHSGIIFKMETEFPSGEYYNLTLWELGTGPDPKIE